MFLGDARFTAAAQPVVGMSWFDAEAYCQWLRDETGVAYRLPTEAEREYAALGGLAGGDWPWAGDGGAFVARMNGLAGPHVPGVECENGFELLCMAENVHEWCGDWYAPGYYAEAPASDPRGPADGTRKVARGGSWRHKDKVTRINARASLVPSFRYNDFGFRVYCDA